MKAFPLGRPYGAPALVVQLDVRTGRLTAVTMNETVAAIAVVTAIVMLGLTLARR